MKLLTIFSRKAPNKVFISILLGALAGMLYSALIPLVLSSISAKDTNFPDKVSGQGTFLTFDVANYNLALLFFLVCILILVMRSISQILLIRVASHVGKDLRVRFYDSIAKAPLASIEKIGTPKLVASINTDVPQIISGAGALPSLLINAITLFGMLGFLVFLNFEVFKLVMLAIVVGVISYQVPMALGHRMLMSSRETRDDLQKGIMGLIHGLKELKLSTKNKTYYFKNILHKHEDSILKNDRAAFSIITLMGSFGDLISFFVIGAVCFIFVNYHSISMQELVGVVMALLYVTGPISMLLESIPRLFVASISYRKLNRLLSEMPCEDSSAELKKVDEWNSLKFNQVEYHYPDLEDEKGFKVGPLNLEINKGEITFIVGANGSGKSTLSKILTLYYTPTCGDISYGNVKLDADNVASYRQNIGAIYSDYFLFDSLLYTFTDELLEMTNHYLKLLKLDKKVKIVDGKFSTISLSDGQRKRLALLVSLMDDKEIYLFDEWAADQDPIFKNVFYHEILPNLKAKNKVVIVISHDDRYFHVADNVLVMENGKLREDETKAAGNNIDLLKSVLEEASPVV